MRITLLKKRMISPHLKMKLKEVLINSAATAFIILIIAWPIHGWFTGYWGTIG